MKANRKPAPEARHKKPAISAEASNEMLVALSIKGNQQAFGQLVERYEAVVARTIYGILGASSEAEDIGQETMIRLYRSLDRFKGQSSLKTYIVKIAVNLCRDALRRRKRQAWQFWKGDDGEELNLKDPTDMAKNTERQQALIRALNTLTPKARSIVVLRLVEGLSTQEVSSILDISEGTVLSRLSRARQKLSEALKEQIDV